jgi:hypothetical protein
MKKKEKKRKRSAEKNVDEREAPRAQTYQKQDLRVFLPQPQGGENVVEPIERPHDSDSCVFFFVEKNSQKRPPKKNLKKTEKSKNFPRESAPKNKKKTQRKQQKTPPPHVSLSLG